MNLPAHLARLGASVRDFVLPTSPPALAPVGAGTPTETFTAGIRSDAIGHAMDPGFASTAGGSGGGALPAPRSTPPMPSPDPAVVIRAILADRWFEVSKAERTAVTKHFAKIAAVHAAMAEHTEDAVVARYKAPSADPRPSKVEALEQAREHRRELKRQVYPLRTECAVIVAPILRRAFDCVVEAERLVEEKERGWAETYAIPFEPSRTLRELRGAVSYMRERADQADRSPDLLDVDGVVRLLGILDETA